MTVIEIVEYVVVAVFVLAHVISNLINARCSCKLCTTVKKFLPSSKEGLSESDTVLLEKFMEWLSTTSKEEK